MCIHDIAYSEYVITVERGKEYMHVQDLIWTENESLSFGSRNSPDIRVVLLLLISTYVILGHFVLIEVILIFGNSHRHVKTPPEVHAMLWEGAILAANRVFVEG